jgi:hypothetical protein
MHRVTLSASHHESPNLIINTHSSIHPHFIPTSMISHNFNPDSSPLTLLPTSMITNTHPPNPHTLTLETHLQVFAVRCAESFAPRVAQRIRGQVHRRTAYSEMEETSMYACGQMKKIQISQQSVNISKRATNHNALTTNT